MGSTERPTGLPFPRGCSQGDERQDAGEIAEVSLEEDKEEVEDVPI